MVTILKGILIGILLYIVVIPIVEGITTIIVQWFEVIKGKLIVELSELQDKHKESKKKINAIGFSISQTDEEDIDDDD